MLTRYQQVESRLDGEPTVEKMMGAFSLDAVNHAATIGVVLDYTEESVDDVEAILARLEQSRPKGLARFFGKGPKESDLETMAKLYGGYIGEVMRFEWGGGDWIIPDEGPFKSSLVLKYDETLMSPPAKVYKRLTDGAEDNVAYYYQVFKERMVDHS
jgi:hypothetical protein